MSSADQMVKSNHESKEEYILKIIGGFKELLHLGIAKRYEMKSS